MHASLARERAQEVGELAIFIHEKKRYTGIIPLPILIGLYCLSFSQAIRLDAYSPLRGKEYPYYYSDLVYVSERVDHRLMEVPHCSFRLSLMEYADGKIYWLAYTFRPSQAVENLLGRLCHPGGKDDQGNAIPTVPLASKKLKRRVRDESGQVVIM